MKQYSKVLIFLIVIGIFTKEQFTIYLGDFGFDIVGNLSCIFIFLIFLKKIINNKIFNIFFFCVFFTGLISMSFFELTAFNFIKTLAPIIIIYYTSFWVIKKNDQKINKIFNLYVQFAYYSALLGLIQFILSLIGINILENKVLGRIDSIAYEPSHYAAIILPAVIFTSLQFNKYKSKALILLMALAGTISLSAYVVLLITLSIYYSNKYSLIFIIPLFFISFQYLSGFNENFFARVDDTKNILNGSSKLTDVNLTVLSFGTNLEVAMHSIKKNPIWGSGLGGHKNIYDSYYKNSLFKFHSNYGINDISAHSLLIRIFSEFGLVGIILYLIFFFKFYIKRSKNKIHHLIYLACLSHFLMKCFKLGAYIDYGTPFFMSIIIVNYLVFKSKKITVNNSH